MLMLLWVVFPLMRGSDTLVQRDIFMIHLPMKHAQAEAMRAGTLPLIDPFRASGQPLLGNLNSVPFYPDNLFYLLGSGVAGTVWALNAHFWLHWLLAPFGFYAMARAWGLSRRASWAGGVMWATSGFFLSQLNLYNMIAGVTLAPLLVASCLGLAGTRRWLAAAATGALWCLLILGGEPLVALLALAGGGAALVMRLPRPWERRELLAVVGPLGVALLLGTLAALPQIVEVTRIHGDSFRGVWGVSAKGASAASFHPMHLLDVLLPLPFGRKDFFGPGSYWAQDLLGLPLLFSLFPGALALGLAVAAGRGRAGTPWRALLFWSWSAVGLGLLLSLGRTVPGVATLFASLGLRYPVKMWLWVSLGLMLLAALGFERAFVRREEQPLRRLVATLGGLAALLLIAGGFFKLAGPNLEPELAKLMSVNRKHHAAFERQRLEGVLLNAGAVAAGFGLIGWWWRRGETFGRGITAPMAALALHSLSQLLWLQPLYSTDSALAFSLESPLAADVPAGSVVVHGKLFGLFGPSNFEEGVFPEPRMKWLTRRALFELYPPAGMLHGRRYAFNPSAEGLDSYWSELSKVALEKAEDDASRLRLLAGFGVERLILDRPLGVDPLPAGIRWLSSWPSAGKTASVWALEHSLPEAALFGTVRFASGPDEVYKRMKDPAFDPRIETVVLGEGPDLEGPPGTVTLLAQQSERVVAEVDSRTGGLLVLRRSRLPVYRATVDGAPAPIRVANFQLLGVPVGPGKHRVEVTTDRRTLGWTIPLSLLAWSSLVLIGLGSRSLTRVGLVKASG